MLCQHNTPLTRYSRAGSRILLFSCISFFSLWKKNYFHMKINGPHFCGALQFRLQSWGPEFCILVLLENCCMNLSKLQNQIFKSILHFWVTHFSHWNFLAEAPGPPRTVLEVTGTWKCFPPKKPSTKLCQAACPDMEASSITESLGNTDLLSHLAKVSWLIY